MSKAKEYYITKFNVDSDNASSKDVIFTSTGSVTIWSSWVSDAKAGDKKAYNYVLSIMETNYYPLVIKGFPLHYRADAVQQAHLGTITAVNKYNPARGNCKFESFAMQYICMATDQLYNEISALAKIPRRVMADYKQSKHDDRKKLAKGMYVDDMDKLMGYTDVYAMSDVLADKKSDYFKKSCDF